MYKFILLSLLVMLCMSACVHDEFIKNTTKHYLNDLHDHRLLQTSTIGPLRIFADYSQVDTTDRLRSLVVKRIMNVTSNYIYNLLKVQRLNKLFFPANNSRSCTFVITSGNSLTVPEKYVTLGVDGDLGIVVGS